MKGQAVKNENDILSHDLKRWAEDDELPPDWPSAGRVWWRWTILKKLRQEQEEERARKSWFPAAGLAGLSCLCLVLLNLVFWSTLDSLTERLAAAGLVEAPLLYYIGACSFLTILLAPMLSWLWLLLHRAPR